MTLPEAQPLDDDRCNYCGKTECRCYDESAPDTIVPDDSDTNPAKWGNG